MKLIITGASGNIATMLVPLLATRGVEMTLIGRDKKKVQALFPSQKTASYKDLPTIASGHDGLLHLASLNNDQEGSFDDFKRANVDLLQEVLSCISQAKLKFFLYPASLHASNASHKDHYSKTKHMAEEVLAKITHTSIHIMRLPAVYGERFSGKLAFLNRCSKILRTPLFYMVASLKPTVSIEKLANVVPQGKNNEAEFLLTDQQKDNWFYKLMARALDLSFALFVLFALWWLILLAVILVKRSSKGPGIFAQTRVGQKGKYFTCYKIRTMKTGTVQRATHQVTTDNITKVGHFLRKTKIDELPQIINILKGEMSLIGPRPCLPTQDTLIDERQKRGVLNDRPGITGWSQANGIDMSDPVKLAISDRYFVDMRTLPLLLKILIKTLISKS